MANNTEMTAQEIIIHSNEPTITAIGKFNSRHTKAVVRKEDGKIYTSIRDAANDAGACYTMMVTHLTHPEKVKSVKGSHYAYLNDMLDNPNVMFLQLRITSAEKERYKAEAEANAEDARKWREHEAKAEAEAKAKAKRQEKKQKRIAELEKQIERDQRIYNGYDTKANRALARLIKHEEELDALMNGKEE